MRCPRSVKKRILLADVAPMSSTHKDSSVLNIRDTSAIALERRESRSWTFGCGEGTGVVRKNFIVDDRVAEAQILFHRGQTPSQCLQYKPALPSGPVYLPLPGIPGAVADGPAEAATATVPAA